MNLHRRQLLIGAGIAVAGAMIGARALGKAKRPRAHFGARRARQPNILLVVTDQERHGSLLPQGLHLPHRDRLYERAMRFSGMNGVTGLCSMARGNIYTGLHYQYNGVYENVPVPFAHDLYKSVPTLGTMLQDAGYETAYFGKWHLSHLPSQPVGTDRMRALLASYGFAISDQDREFDGALAGFDADRGIAEKAAQFIGSRRNARQPWFAAVNFVNPHDIMYFLATQRQFETYVQLPIGGVSLKPAPDDPLFRQNLGFDLPANFGKDADSGRVSAHKLFELDYDMGLGRIPLDDRDAWRNYQNYYFNCLRDVDRNIGIVYDALDASGGWNDTVVVFVSDHGELSGAHGLRGKGNVVYRENCSVPFAVWHPDMPAGGDTAALASHIDIAPTLLAFAGISEGERRAAYPQLQGVDLSEAIHASDRGTTGSGRKGVLYQWDSRIYGVPPQAIQEVTSAHGALSRTLLMTKGLLLEGMKTRSGMRGVFDGRYKFARYFRPTEHNVPGSFADLVRFNDLELYDTRADPLEQTNLAARPGNEALLWKMAMLCNELIALEIGEDRAQMLPGPQLLWNVG
ncbi:arylsulfatase A-like enzyme [Paraburkholderia sp. MM5496-R1]|uniref:sulfatase-like hydrolase/transferase n=1 Tax=Paraburkholderia sp. MM5496-R1 TaxID=2991065 RepID=UPI003D1ADE50